MLDGAAGFVGMTGAPESPGTGGVTAVSGGMLLLSGVSSFRGGTTLAGGVVRRPTHLMYRFVRLAKTPNPEAGPVTLRQGRLALSAGRTFPGDTTLKGGVIGVAFGQRPAAHGRTFAPPGA